MKLKELLLEIEKKEKNNRKPNAQRAYWQDSGSSPAETAV